MKNLILLTPLLLLLGIISGCDDSQNLCKNVNCGLGECFIDGENALCSCYDNAIKVNGICVDNNECTNGSIKCNDGYHCIVTKDTKLGHCDDIDECLVDDTCGVGFNCVNTGGSYECIDINECNKTIVCGEYESCVNTIGSYNCDCILGYHKINDMCVDINECDTQVDNCSDDGCCLNTNGGFNCQCNVGYNGDGVICNDINECDNSWSNNCDVNALCSNIQGGYYCECKDGFIGDGETCSDIDECINETLCDDGKICFNTVGSYQCVDDNECETNVCDENAVCSNTDGGYTCSCNYGFEGNGMVCSEACGNNIYTPSEECDGTDLNRNTCESSGFHNGIITCDNNCMLNTDNCYNYNSFSITCNTSSSIYGIFYNDIYYFSITNGSGYLHGLKLSPTYTAPTSTDFSGIPSAYDSKIFSTSLNRYAFNGTLQIKNILSSTITSKTIISPAADYMKTDIVANDTNVYVVISNSGSIILRKLTSSGDLVWSRQTNTITSATDNNKPSIFLDATGVYVVFQSDKGYAQFSTTTSHDIFVMKYDFNGDRIWVNKIDDGNNNIIRSAYFSNNNIIVVYSSDGGTSYKKISSISADGDLNWNKTTLDTIFSLDYNNTNMYVLTTSKLEKLDIDGNSLKSINISYLGISNQNTKIKIHNNLLNIINISHEASCNYGVTSVVKFYRFDLF